MAEGGQLVNAVELRRASADDLHDIVELNRAGNGDHIAEEMSIVFRLGAMAPSDYAVAVAGGRVVATVGLLATQLRVGSVTLPVGQPEYVGTADTHRGHGVARRLLELVQEWSEWRGDLVQIIAGVAYFYRQYGYAYGLLRPPELAVPPEHKLVLPGEWQARTAELRDVDRIRALQAEAQAQVDVALPFADNLWPAFLEMPAAPLLVGLVNGRVDAVGRLRVASGHPVRVQAVAASKASAVAGVQAILAETRARHPGATLVVADREGSAIQAVLPPPARLVAKRNWLYVRVPSLAAVLSVLTPVLNERLARSAYAEQSTELVVSLYRSSVRLGIDHGRVVEVSAGPGVHEPDDDGAVGIPPDLVPLLLFGEGGVLALEDHPDVYLGTFRQLMAALFPPLRLDLLTW